MRMELRPRLSVVGMEIAGVDAHLVHERRDGKGGLRREMDVRHDGDFDALIQQRPADIPDGGDFLLGRDGDADDVRTGRSHSPALGERRFHVGSLGVAHRLDGQGVAAADDEVTAYRNRECLHSAGVVRQVWG